MTSIKSILAYLVLSSLIFLVGCETWRSECSGEILVENMIPDTTLYLGGEEFQRDISKPPIVFRHTENKRIRIGVVAENLDIVGAGTGIDEENNRHIIKITPRNPGSTKVTIIAKDDCEGREVPTTFNVTVSDTTQ